MIFTYLHGTTYLHKMDARKRFLAFIVLQIAIFQKPLQLVHLMLPILFLVMICLLPRLLIRFIRCLLVFSPLFFLMFIIYFLDQGRINPLPRVLQIVYSLFSAELLLSVSSISDFMRISSWLSKKIPFLSPLFETIMLSFIFLPEMSTLYTQLNTTLKLRNCSSLRHPLHYLSTFTLAFLRELFMHTAGIEATLVLRNYGILSHQSTFSKARGESLCLVGIIAVVAGSIWRSTLF